MSTFQRLAVISIVTFLAACSRSSPPADVVYEQQETMTHIVRKGETLARIAKRYGMTRSELISVNGLKSPYRLTSGQRLNVNKKRSAVNADEVSVGATGAKTYASEGVEVKTLAPLPATKEAPQQDEKPFVKAEAQVDSMKKSEDSTQETNDDEDNETSQKETKPTKVEKPMETPLPQATGQFIWPVEGKVIKEFGAAGGQRSNDGINIAASKGTPVKAAESGVVARAGNQLKVFGNYVLIKHNNGLITAYTHLDQINVKVGEAVQRGQKIGTVGSSGKANQPQLHFEVRKGKTPIDPKRVLT